MSVLSSFVLVIYTLCSLFILVYGINTCVVIYLFLRKRKEVRLLPRTEVDASVAMAEKDLPVVTTQIPLYNELNVAERVIRAVAAIDYPHDKHEIQVLDDSDDETRELVDTVAAELSSKGHWVEVIRRKDRIGYKAGALQLGMEGCKGEYIAIFDSDFMPTPDFLKRTVPVLVKDERCALVQARWDHINQNDSWLTRAQAVGIDGHFVVEQTARNRNGLFMNFCGTAGVWRRAAIEDSGNWEHDTVTEDLDLSYRAQLKGWKFHYMPDLLVPAELPTTYTAFKSQQYRWAKGSIQTARKMLPRVWKAKLPIFTKWQATVHLTHYALHFQMALLALLILPLMLCFLNQDIPLYQSKIFLSLLVPAALGPTIGYAVCQYYGHPRHWKQRVLYLPFLLVIGFGICLSNGKAVLEGLFGNDSTFVRTPKAGQKSIKQYCVKKNWVPRLEIGYAAYCLLTAAFLVVIGNLSMLPFVGTYTAGFALVGFNSIKEL
ncbi:glycosyltransferase [Rubellicoccus peritrichatus]|uniref:Glycosyltransferase n=1 Tax=Rubellicoccus peritrichatus TaxID=3080537 RepID=A0AAQ3L5E0_9BACT|nr:glycosyltransferase [Puniceicoccus sp. CR14]WOO39734.1 glycosyltransferase [Puniceicoccus sp. CR14]